MAFIDDPEFVIAHIRHSCVITDDTGMCEQVIMNEEFENEKAIKHRKRLIGKYSVDRDSLDVPSYPQSFDIAVSPELSLRNSKAQGKGDRNRREKNREIRCTTVSWKEGQKSALSAEDLSNVFAKREVKPAKNKAVTVSQLSRQLEESRGKPNNPFLEYSKFEGEAYQGTCPTKKTQNIFNNAARGRKGHANDCHSLRNCLCTGLDRTYHVQIHKRRTTASTQE